MKTWTESEVHILIENYNRVSNTSLQRLIPSKSPLAIYRKAYRLGLRKSPEIEFLNRSDARRGDKCPNWRGGIKKTQKGYRMVLCPGHPRADAGGYVMEHIIVWEKESGTKLPANCCIHHLNGIKDDNSIDNLCVMLHTAHTVHHHKGSKRSEATRSLISAKAKERFSDKRNHPAYKEVDISQIQSLIDKGSTVIDACKAVGIGKTAYYRKRREQNEFY